MDRFEDHTYKIWGVILICVVSYFYYKFFKELEWQIIVAYTSAIFSYAHSTDVNRVKKRLIGRVATLEERCRANNISLE